MFSKYNNDIRRYIHDHRRRNHPLRNSTQASRMKISRNITEKSTEPNYTFAIHDQNKYWQIYSQNYLLLKTKQLLQISSTKSREMKIAKGFRPSQSKGAVVMDRIFWYLRLVLPRMSMKMVIITRDMPVMPIVINAQLTDHIFLFSGISQMKGNPISPHRTLAIAQSMTIFLICPLLSNITRQKIYPAQAFRKAERLVNSPSGSFGYIIWSFPNIL